MRKCIQLIGMLTQPKQKIFNLSENNAFTNGQQ